ncbi:MAG TPA: hypothetical protein PKN95_12770 [Verrucomicrobiota bacterium]|nr:hypothetical protein [Verrucomicrobiota bacterium]HNT15801.1 hypothetical protein [Verrucomicrobiota bacterium]
MKHLGALIFGVLVVCLVILGLFGYRYWVVGGKTQREIIDIYRLVSPGDSLTELESHIATSNFTRLRIKEISTTQVALVPTAVTRFANDWVLFLTLEDAKISAMRIRTLESQMHHPGDAPPDKVRTTGP